MWQIQHLADTIPHMVPHHGVDLHLKWELFSPFQLCGRVHSDSHLCFHWEEAGAQEAQGSLWTMRLLMKEENQAVISLLILTEDLDSGSLSPPWDLCHRTVIPPTGQPYSDPAPRPQRQELRSFNWFKDLFGIESNNKVSLFLPSGLDICWHSKK